MKTPTRPIALLGLAVLIMFALIRVGHAAEPSTAAATEQEFLSLEKVWNDAHLQGDAATLDRLWAEELTVTVPAMPVFNKAQSLGVWRTGRMKFTRYETSELKFLVQSDLGIVTGRLVRERTVADKPMREDWRFTKVYVKRDGRWQVIAWHASPATTS